MKVFLSYLYIILTRCIVYNYFKQYTKIELIKIKKSNSILNEILIRQCRIIIFTL